MSLKATVEIPLDAFADFLEYILDHEEDILNGVNDYGSLRKIYDAMYPQEEKGNDD